MKFLDLLSAFMRVKDRHNKFTKLKNDPEVAPKVVRYGVTAIILDVIAIILVVLCMLYFEIITNTLVTNGGIVIIFTVLIWVAALSILIVLPIALIISALINSIYQLKINKKAIGWVALSLTILTIVAAVVLFLMLI